MPTKSSTVKNYISACSNGELEKLSEMLHNNPMLKGINNHNSGKSGLYYSVRNLKLNTSRFLIERGLRLDSGLIIQIIHNNWHASIPSYKFLLELGDSVYEKHTISKDQLFDYYKMSCYSNHKIGKLISLYEFCGKKINLPLIISEYQNHVSNKDNINYKTNIRELKLKLLL